MKINSIDKTIRQVLSSDYYQIPRFQRPYSWDRENISDFWADVIVESESDYFIGSMVVFKEGSDIYGIVDGQQRLTTITILLCILRNILSANDFADLASGIHNLIERPNISNKQQFVLSTETSYPYFQEYIQKFGKPTLKIEAKSEEYNIENCFRQLSSYVTDAVEAIKIDSTIKLRKKKEKIKEKLISIREKILNLKLIFIELDNEDDAYIIFETLNTRGKDLSVSDLVKNHLVKSIKPQNSKLDTTKIKWGAILSTIEGSAADLDVDSFLQHFWLSKYDYVTIKKLFKAVKKSISRSNAQAFLNDLESESITYREIYETNFKKWRSEEFNIKQSLDGLSVFRVKQQVPMVLAVMRNYKQSKLKKKHVEDIVSSIEKFHFIFTAVTSQRSSGGISQMYASAARRLENAQSMPQKIRVLKDLKNKMRARIPTYEEFEIGFSEIIYTNEFTKNKNLVQYILSRIDAYLQPSHIIDYKNMTLEHIEPQNPKDRKRLPVTTTGQLGNLLYLSDKINQKLKNKSFSEKKKILIDNNISLDKDLKNANNWQSAEIKNRTKYLAKIAYKRIWAI